MLSTCEEAEKHDGGFDELVVSSVLDVDQAQNKRHRQLEMVCPEMLLYASLDLTILHSYLYMFTTELQRDRERYC